MSNIKMNMNANARIVSKVLTRNKNTFYAMKELINNSIQAGAKCININLIPHGESPLDLEFEPIHKIEIIDNGHGVPFSEFHKSILEVATDNKPDGCGVGRFSGLQIGQIMKISTIGFESKANSFTETSTTFNSNSFTQKDLTSIELDVLTKELTDAHNCGYRVEISQLYTNESNCPKRNKLGQEFLPENLPLKLFEHYPLYIFNNTVRFVINGKNIQRNDIVKEPPRIQKLIYNDIVGEKHEVRIQYFSLILNEPKIRLFIQSKIGDVDSTVLEMTYNSMWYSSSMGTQYILIESDFLTPDFIDTSVLGDMSKEWKDFAGFLKKSIDNFYKEGNEKFHSFIKRLKSDHYYPYTPEEAEQVSLSTELFNQSAFAIEDDLKLLHNSNTNRALIYSLLRKVIDDGNITFILQHVMGLSKESNAHLTDLLDKTNLEEIINFSATITDRLRFLEMLEKIALTEVEKHVDLYPDITTAISRNLWIFGDEYSYIIPTRPHSNITSYLDFLLNKYIPNKASKKLNNCIEGCKRSVKKLGHLALYNEKRLDFDKKEIASIIIFPPSVQITQNEILAIDNYIYDVEKSNSLPKNKIIYKFYFMAIHLTDFAKSKMEEQDRERFLYSYKNSKNNEIKVYLIDFASIIEYNRENLSCASETLRLNKIDVESAFLQDYSNLMERKNTSQLHLIK